MWRRKSGNLPILVVDDHEDSAETLALLLESYGYETVVAYSAAEALGLARDLAVGLVFLDLVLPDSTGYELARSLRKTLEHGVQIIALTALSGIEVQSSAHDAGIDALLTKPVFPEVLRAALERSPPKQST